MKDLVATFMAAMEGSEPEIGVMNPAYAALDKLKVSVKIAQLKRAKPQEGKADIRQVRTTEEGD